MKKLEGEQVMMRIFIAEGDRLGSKPLYQAIMEMLKQEKAAGATLIRGIMGFGAKSHFRHAHIMALSQDLPMIIEVVDTQEAMDEIIPKIDGMIKDGLVTLEKVKVLRYEPQD